MTELERIFFDNNKLTENGDIAFHSTEDKLIDLLFLSQYYRNHLPEVSIGLSDREKLFSRFMRDPRFGLGERDLGRVLMEQSQVAPQDVIVSGRADDLLNMEGDIYFNYFLDKLRDGDYLFKKWSPRLTSGKESKEKAFRIKRALGLSDKEYRHLIKCDTVEKRVSHFEKIDDYSKLPSLALKKHYSTFQWQDEDRFEEFLNEVKSKKKKINTEVLTPYDILNVYREDVNLGELLFEQLPKVSLGRIIPIIDNSGSMYDDQDSAGKARSIGHFVAKNSSYLNNHIISFSSMPKLLKLGSNYREDMDILDSYDDVSNTNLGRVMEMLGYLKYDFPDYLLVLSDMEFDQGSSESKNKTMEYFRKKGAQTKIIWWNFNTRGKTCPETDIYGNIFLSGYSPQLLKFLEVEFDAKRYLDILLENYEKNIDKLVGKS